MMDDGSHAFSLRLAFGLIYSNVWLFYLVLERKQSKYVNFGLNIFVTIWEKCFLGEK